MAITHYYVDPLNGNDGNAGTSHATARKTTQAGLNLCTNTSGVGDQLNICSSAVDTLTAGLTLPRSPTLSAPIVVSGYTSVANDGGRGHVSYPGNGLVATANVDYTFWKDLNLEGGGNPTRLITLRNWNTFFRVRFIANNGGYMFNLTDSNRVIGCLIDGPFATPGLVNNHNLLAFNVSLCANGFVGGGSNNVAAYNVVRLGVSYSAGIGLDDNANTAFGNVVVNTSAGTVRGLSLGNFGGREGSIAFNNVVAGQSGAGGVGIGTMGGHIWVLANNAFWNNTTNVSSTGQVLADIGGDVQLQANPFVDAAGGDLSLTGAARAALAAVGWPATYLDQTLMPKVAIGSQQFGTTSDASGGALRRVMRLVGG